MVTRPCSRCTEVKPLAGYYPDPTKKDGHHTICKECVKADRKRRYRADPEKYLVRNRAYYRANRERWREWDRNIRAKVLEEYGGACACCGETTPEFLSIDHVHNDGAEHRREIGGYGQAIYKWLRREGYPKDGRFQILCHNCNQAKGFYGVCPHLLVTS